VKFKFTKDNALIFEKAGVAMWVYSSKKDLAQCNVIYQEVDGGHYEEFVIEDKEYPVVATDVIVVPPRHRFYYVGHMKQVLVVAPAWEDGCEETLRVIR